MAKPASRSPISPFYPRTLSEDSGLGFGESMPSARPGQVGDDVVREEAVYVGEDGPESIDAEDVQPVRTFKTPDMPPREDVEEHRVDHCLTVARVMRAEKALGERMPTAMWRASPLP